MQTILQIPSQIPCKCRVSPAGHATSQQHPRKRAQTAGGTSGFTQLMRISVQQVIPRCCKDKGRCETKGLLLEKVKLATLLASRSASGVLGEYYGKTSSPLGISKHLDLITAVMM